MCSVIRMRGKRDDLRGGLGDGQFQPVRILLLHQRPTAVRSASMFDDRPRLYGRVQKTHLLPGPIQM